METVPRRRNSVCAAIAALLAVTSPRGALAQASACTTDRTVSTLVGAGLGAAAAAMPATIVHRHDQTSSHRILAVSVSTGAVLGFLAASRDRPCVARADSAQPTTDPVIVGRSNHAGRGAVAGAAIGGVLGAVGGSFYNIGCTRDPCNATRERVYVMAFSASEGALAGGLLGTLIGWAWPAGRR